MAGIELRHLEALVAVADEGSITRAAARLHTAQPAVSRTVQQLEQRLGVALLVRSAEGVIPTPDGQAVLVEARAALAAVDRVRSVASRTGRPLVLGYSWGAAGRLPVELVGSWRRDHPDRPVTWRRIDHRLAGLVDGTSDVALVRGDVVLPGDGPPPSWLATMHLGDEERVAALPRDHGLAGLAEVGLDDLAGEAIIVNRVGGITHPQLWPPGRRPRTAREVTNTDDWLLAIAAGDGVGVTTTTTASTATHPDVVFVPMPSAPLVPLRLAWRTDAPSHPDLPDLLRHAHRHRTAGEGSTGRRRACVAPVGVLRSGPASRTHPTARAEEQPVPRTVPSSAGSTPVDLHVEDSGGDGRPVVLIHGWPLDADSWKAQVPALTEAGYRVIAYDRRGFGRSDKPQDGYDYDTFAGDLDAVMTGLDLREVTLVGFSMGGGEVARYVGRHGTDRVRAVAFLGAVPPYLFKTEDNPDGGVEEELVQGMQSGIREDRDGFFDGFAKGFYSAGDDLKVDESELAQFQRMQQPARDEAVLGCVDAFARTDFRADLDRVDVPALVVHGDSDAIVPFEVSGRRTAQTLDATLVLVEQGPHGIGASHPDQVNAALLDFLAAH